MSSPNVTSQLDPGVIFEALTSYQKPMALKGALDLELFTHIADGATSAQEIAARCQASERGVRILCDFLTIHGFLTKHDGAYGLPPNSAVFLNKRSPAYMGSAADFLTHEFHRDAFNDIAATVRKGGAITTRHGAMEPESLVWVEFARAMAPLSAMGARALATIVAEPGKPMKVLDIAAGPGGYGIAVAVHNPAAEVVALDWKNVLEVSVEHARQAGVANRYRTIAGSAFEAEFGGDYDLILLPNFLHHFDAPANVTLLKKVRAALRPGGQLAVVEFVPNDDRVTPPISAAFSFTMLAATDYGDAYTFHELAQMLRDAGFGESRMQDLAPSPQRLILATA